MNKTTEALKLAENTLEDIIRVYKFETGTPVTALAAIREALADHIAASGKVIAEPVAWDLAEKVRRDLDRKSCPDAYMRIAMESIVKHYAAPVKREWVDLTDGELKAALEVHQVGLSVRIGRIAIAAYKEKNK